MRSPQERHWRLILSPPASGAQNMALDEAILQAVRDNRAPTTLRMYAWEPPCLSLGHAQPLAEIDIQLLHAFGWDIVRRSTGGRAILHTDELTYMVAGAARSRLFAGGVLPTYRRISRGLVAGLRLLGLHPEVQSKAKEIPAPRSGSNPICFEMPSAYEITVGGRKLLGSAQVRRRGGVMQHGTLPLTGDITRICQVLRFQDQATRTQAAKRLGERAVTVEASLQKSVSWDQVADSLSRGFSQALDLDLDLEEPTPAEEQAANELVAKRFANSDWTERI
ncbi:MAG: biotin/lipoate A/B protein ligase family protein [Anaerolineales bacterium]